jgi:hypothetical protein
MFQEVIPVLVTLRRFSTYYHYMTQMKVFQITLAYNPQQGNLVKIHDYVAPQKMFEVLFGYQFETPQEDGKFLQPFCITLADVIQLMALFET